MKLIRSILITISFFFFGMGSLFLGLICFPLIKLLVHNNYKRLNCYSEFIHHSWSFLIKYLQFIKMINLNIEDIKKISNIKNSIIVSTHPSYIDVVVLLALIPKTTCFVAPRLAKNTILKNIVNSMFLISGKSLDDLQKDTEIMLQNGFNVLIFPSGIRHRRNEQPKIRKGASLIALNSKKDIVPIVMYTDFDFLQIGQPFYDVGEKAVTFNIKVCNTIHTKDFLNNTDSILIKREITNNIKNALYEL